MGFFDSFTRSKPVAGEIGYHKLVEWWNTGLTEIERKWILEVFQPLGSGKNGLIEGNIVSSSESTLAFLTNLSGWFTKEDDRLIGYKILRHAESNFAQNSKSMLDIHFFYQILIQMHYRDRADEDHLKEAENACRRQIDIEVAAGRAFKKDGFKTLPEHVGFKQLSIILENRKSFKEAISLAQQAKASGWAGDWDKRIEKYTNKL